MTRALVLSHVFPRPTHPSFGIFVRRRVEHVARLVPVEVVAPLPWFPAGHLLGRVRRGAVPRTATVGQLRVDYPTVPSIPGVGRSLDPILFATALLPFLRKLRRRYAFDLIDAHFGYPDGVAAAWLGRWLACPVLITLRGCEQEQTGCGRRQLAWALRRTRVVCVSDELAQLASMLGASAPRVIANGVDASVFHPGDRREARHRLGLPQDATILLGPGAFVAIKRHDRLLEVAARLRAAGQTRLVYVALGSRGGPRSSLPALAKRAAELGIEAHVRFVTDRPHEEMPQWFRAADVLCLASEREGSPNAVIEALACGLPVVAVGVGEIPQLVRPAIDGFVLARFEPTEFAAAVGKALDSRWDPAAIAGHGARRSWEVVAREVVEEMQAAADDFRTNGTRQP